MFPSSRVSVGAPFPPPQALEGLPGRVGVRKPTPGKEAPAGNPSPRLQVSSSCVTSIRGGSVPGPRPGPKARPDHLVLRQGLLPGHL